MPGAEERRAKPGPREPGSALREAKSKKAKKALSTRGARKKAQQQVCKSATKLVDALVKKSGGNYLAVKFLFDFAGLTETVEESHQESPMLKAYRQYLEKAGQEVEAEQTSDANLNLSTVDSNQKVR